MVSVVYFVLAAPKVFATSSWKATTVFVMEVAMAIAIALTIVP